ncbi:hypothetical protein PHYPSEUDO_011411 [Phytophthora pseudosyringae]|uniref:RxLR effector protein n=1 Tax=Phytophthora pseudosyringae TaxID=221518 RepID=A0A8T1V9E0_9STRA|nr:hypothetical protein PHYPSEUDO_011411 [Phytophthora pseudosyringae]
MQLVKGLFIAAALCVALVSAGNAQQEQEEQNGNQYQVESDSKSGSGTSSPGVQKGFDVHQVKFTSSDPEEEKGEESSSSYVPLVAAVGACACIGVLGAVYLKRRNDDDKLPGEIFTIDDKNSVL